MDSDEVTIIELLTVQAEHADEAKELIARSVQYFRQTSGVHRAWAVQDRAKPGEFAFVSLVDAARVAEIQRATAEAEWHKAMQPRWHEILDPGKFRQVIGPSLKQGA